MYEKVHEQIQVSATFQKGKVLIHSFTWKDKQYDVEALHLPVHARRGRESVWMFYVSTAGGAYKLRFDTDTLFWWIEEVSWEEGAETRLQL